MTTPLSPAAQEVLDAYNQDRPVGDSLPRNALVEALRAAADQLREAYANELYVDPADDWLNAIADELAPPTSS